MDSAGSEDGREEGRLGIGNEGGTLGRYTLLLQLLSSKILAKNKSFSLFHVLYRCIYTVYIYIVNLSSRTTRDVNWGSSPSPYVPWHHSLTS